MSETEYQRHKARIDAIISKKRESKEEALRNRVDRDPCPYCAVRADVGCKHRRF